MEIKNEYGIKIGDIFYSDSDIKSFVQVVGLKSKKQVIVREIEKELYEKLPGGYEFKVRPIPNKFKENSNHLEDNINGDAKTVMKKGSDCYDAGELYISIKIGYKNYRNDYYLWKDEELIDNYWSVWMR